MVSVRYLLNQWMDFDQTCTDTILGGGEELTRFGDLDIIIFQGHHHPIKTVLISHFHTLSSEPVVQF